MKNKKSIPYLIPVALALVLAGFYIYGNIRAIRYCNCKNTEDWKPGQERVSGSRGSGYNRFYHK